MQHYESFGECLRRCLKEGKLSASEAARLVGFRSRNSIFRILSGDTSDEVKLRFLSALHDALGSQWPEERWLALQQALSVERLGVKKYQAYQAFDELLYALPEAAEYTVERLLPDGGAQTISLADVLDEISAAEKAEVVITGCCDSGLSRLLAERFAQSGAQGKVSVRHYIDTEPEMLTQRILGILPLISKPWYNARLVDLGACPEEMLALYRLNALHVNRWDADGRQQGGMFICYDKNRFASRLEENVTCATIMLLDRWRFKLELLKPLQKATDGPQAFVEYTEQYRLLEKDCTICSIKPDIHFNCIPTDVLEQAIIEGFEHAGMAAGPELTELIEALKCVHEGRYQNMLGKHRPTHLVYSFPAMERFMRTGVQTDHFFIQRAYTVEERRKIVAGLLEAMHSRPWFNIYFLREEAPELCNEITLYEGKGVLMMDAYTGYELDVDHSEALISLPTFMESFQSYFMEELLNHHVMSRADTLRCMERLLVMNIQE